MRVQKKVSKLMTEQQNSNIIPLPVKELRYFPSELHKDIACFFSDQLKKAAGMVFSEGSFWMPSPSSNCWVEVPDDFVKDTIWRGKHTKAKTINPEMVVKPYPS